MHFKMRPNNGGCFVSSLMSSSGLYIQRSRLEGSTADIGRVAEVEHKSEAAFVAMRSDLIKIR